MNKYAQTEEEEARAEAAEQRVKEELEAEIIEDSEDLE
jgi:hypothetical protein